jgi:hypothetical protein
MKSLVTGLQGPKPLTSTSIDNSVRGTSPGAYALGHVDSLSVFRVSYVGRSDSDLNARLHNHIGVYRHFIFWIVDTKRQAFEKECQLFHEYDPPDNDVHPARPPGTSYSCPVAICSL